MLETKERKVQPNLGETGDRPSDPQDAYNWLFICRHCGHPIFFHEALITVRTHDDVRVVHLRCRHQR